MSTPEPNPETTDYDDYDDVCGPCPECEAAWDVHDVITHTIYLGFLALVFLVLRMATDSLAGGWTDWSYVAAGVLAAYAAHALHHVLVPATSLVRRAVARRIQNRRALK